MTQSLIVQNPAGKAAQLFLLFHGVGATADGLVALGRRLAAEFPQAAVVSVGAPHASDLGAGLQWFSARGVTDENRSERIAQAMPLFVETVRHWQSHFGVAPEATALVGFSQGAIMSLESARLGKPLAGRVVSIAGRFAQLPELAPEHSCLHLLHGKTDAVIHYGHAVSAAERLVALGADVTADVLPFTGHELTQEMVDLLVERLTSHVPQRHWRAAQDEAPEHIQSTPAS